MKHERTRRINHSITVCNYSVASSPNYIMPKYLRNSNTYKCLKTYEKWMQKVYLTPSSVSVKTNLILQRYWILFPKPAPESSNSYTNFTGVGIRNRVHLHNHDSSNYVILPNPSQLSTRVYHQVGAVF